MVGGRARAPAGAPATRRAWPAPPRSGAASGAAPRRRATRWASARLLERGLALARRGEARRRRAAGSARARTGCRGSREARPPGASCWAAASGVALAPARSRRAHAPAPPARRDGRSWRRWPTAPRRRHAPRRAVRGGRRSTRPSAGPRPRSGGPRCAPTARGGSGSSRRRRPRCPRAPRARRGRPGCPRCIDTTSSRVAVSRQRASSGRAPDGSPRKARIEPRTPSATSVAPAPAPGERRSSAELRRAVPVAQLAQDVGHAAEAGVLQAVRPVGLAEADRRGERVARAAVVARDLVGRAEPLVDLCRLRRQLVLERQRQTRSDGLHARRRTRRPSPAPRPGGRAPAPAGRPARRARPPRRRGGRARRPRRAWPALCR